MAESLVHEVFGLLVLSPFFPPFAFLLPFLGTAAPPSGWVDCSLGEERSNW